MAAVGVCNVSVVTLPASLPASREMLGQSLSAAGNLAPRLRPCAKSRFVTVSARARAPEFSRRLIRVQVSPRINEVASIRSVPVQVARELLNAGHRYLDVRTSEEFAAGHVEGAVNVPYLKSAGGGMTKNLHFVEEVARLFHKDDEIVVGCLSGRRSLMAAAELQAAEFSGVTDMMGGHKAWVDSGLASRVRV